MRITEKDLTEDLIRVRDIINNIPSKSIYILHGKYNIKTFLRRKKWNEWLNELFGEVNQIGISRKKLDKSDLINNLFYIRSIIGKIPGIDDLKIGKYSYESYRCAFGNLRNALKCFEFSNEDIYNDLLRVFSILNRPFSVYEFYFLSNTIKRNFKRFGEFKEICIKLNIPILTKEDIIKDVKEVYNELGYISQKAYIKHSKMINSLNSVYSNFDSFNDLLEKANIPIVRRRNLIIEELKSELKKYVEISGNLECLGYWQITKAKQEGKFLYSATAIKNNFPGKTWEEIMNECGFPYKSFDQFYGRKILIGKDGNEYLSALEKQVGDQLFESGVNYEYEAKVCEERKWTCDFKIFTDEIIWLEVDGMGKNRKNPYYETNEKIEYYKANGYNYKIISYFEKFSIPDIIKMSSKA